MYLGLVLVGATPAYSQSDLTNISGVVDLRNRKTCEELRDAIRNADVNLLWFNSRSVSDYSRVLESVFDAFPEKKAGWFDLAWTTSDAKRPLRMLNPPSGFLAPILIDEDERKHLSNEVWELVNGFSAAEAFEYKIQRDAAETVATLKINFSGVEPSTFLAAYESALNLARCEDPIDPDYTSIRQLAFNNAQLSIQNNALVIVTRLPRGSISPRFTKDAN